MQLVFWKEIQKYITEKFIRENVLVSDRLIKMPDTIEQDVYEETLFSKSIMFKNSHLPIHHASHKINGYSYFLGLLNDFLIQYNEV